MACALSLSKMSAKMNPTVNKLRVNAPVELEDQFILRLPAEQAEILGKALKSSNSNIEERLMIDVKPDMRHAVVRFDSWTLGARFEDLPCICESLKTTDRKLFYKVADISQILRCTHETSDSSEGENHSPDKTETFLHAHGVTKPLKNVRKRRFRKTLRKFGGKNKVDDTENEVMRLLSMDQMAASVRWEVLEEPVVPVGGGKRKLPTEFDIFGEVSSSSDDEIAKFIDTSEDNEDESQSFTGSGYTEEAELQMAELGVEDEVDVLGKQRGEIKEQLAKVRAKKKTFESVVRSVKNQALKQRFLDTISELVERENDLKSESEKF